MVDILAIGSGAVNAYRQALSTTSNNIANVNTPGYSRRALSIGESFPVQEGVFSFGTGAQTEAVARAYDEFLERSLRDAKSDLAVHEPVIKYANRVIDIMATETASLANAMEDFFNVGEFILILLAGFLLLKILFDFSTGMQALSELDTLLRGY